MHTFQDKIRNEAGLRKLKVTNSHDGGCIHLSTRRRDYGTSVVSAGGGLLDITTRGILLRVVLQVFGVRSAAARRRRCEMMCVAMSRMMMRGKQSDMVVRGHGKPLKNEPKWRQGEEREGVYRKQFTCQCTRTPQNPQNHRSSRTPGS